ncbi:hypothetical protein [Archangium violaceum]|uniref:hypothetical protein n=1 Tax=Archangium violaceum TaxID=83451 RepID=UPI0037C0B17C
MSTRFVGPRLAESWQRLALLVLALVVLALQMGCATGAPLEGSHGGYRYRPLVPHGVKAAPSSRGSPERSSPAQDVEVLSGARVGERARQVEAARAEALVLELRRGGRGPQEDEAAREAEVDRAVARMVGLCSGVEEVEAVRVFTFWVEGGALTQVGYQEQRGGGRAGRPVDAEGLARMLRRVFTEYAGRRTGEVMLRLRREETRWAVAYDATHSSARPPDARTLPVRTRGTPANTFLAFHEAAGKWASAVQVPVGGGARVELEVRLEDGRLAGWELSEVRRTREGAGGNPRPLSREAMGQLVQALLPFTEGLGARTVHVVLNAEHRMGEVAARGRVESARVERSPQLPGSSWYLSMHESVLLRWREGVVEGSAWLAQWGVEELTLWLVGGIIAKGLGFFATEGLEWVTRALGREPEAAAGWLRTALKRLPGEERATFEQLWGKVLLEGEQALSRSERKALRGLFVRLEQAVQQPLDVDLKGKLREEARKYYAELYPQFAELLEKEGKELPIHHRRPLQYAHLFPDENINAGENLAMLQKYVHEEINLLWGKFRKARPNPTADDVRRAAEAIDRQFEPWYHRAIDSPGMLKTVDDAREAALRELRSRFRGLE